MLKLITGKNTKGKTRYLINEYLKHPYDISFIGYDDDRIRTLEVKRNVTVENYSDSRILSIAELLSRSYRTLFVDEIDSYVHPLDKHILYNILKELSGDMDITAVTHDVQFTSYGDLFYTVDCDDNECVLVDLTEEEYRKLV